MPSPTPANERDFVLVVRCVDDGLDGGDEGERGLGGYEAAEGAEDEGGVVFEDVSVGHGRFDLREGRRWRRGVGSEAHGFEL